MLWQSLAIFLHIAAMLGILLGSLLVFKPDLLERINRVANRWISLRHVERMLDRSFSIEHWFYRYHRLLGIAIVLGATYILIYFGFLFDKAYALQHLGSKAPARLLDILLDALILFLLLGAAVALVAGLIVWLRPSLLRGFEEGANQWVSTRRATKVLDVPHDQLERFVTRHARQIGWLLLLGSIYLFFAMFRVLM
ncbi:MAG: hypothetical protein A3G79_01310 [Gallionellales bacterium RIFCSPLOWO2_12_FULL_57_18]|nr:MAG: hypothetical protein A3G79_01310 [Gallionellales bacterium RIFCSPLOWO2_12_FULL_57_18]OGS97027.1 MAG: hypothetical protein A3H31_05950 [Gallionellales bacterium RIFCSPLOWO2_02_FULL_57_47]OGT12569.1 MAG: hypothetical protein A3J49_00420 [Gallionellales bacterium RIFCSPHIGHO2_02_FULL_57_16]